MVTVRKLRSPLMACALVACLAGATLWAGTSLAPHSAVADTTSTSTGAGAASTTQNSVTVSAGGDVTVAPDMATVTLGVQLTRDSALNAQIAANDVVAAAVRNLHALHVPDRQIQTASISLQPHYDNAGSITGYDASQTLSVIVYGLRLVGPVVDAGVSAHANNNVSIAFGLRSEDAARTAALKLAVQTARARAEAAASALGRSLAGAHVQITEGSQQIPPRPVLAADSQGGRSLATPTQAFGGTLTVHEDVTLTYVF